MITDAERKAALLALQTLRKHLDEVMTERELDQKNTDTVLALSRSIIELNNTEVVEGSY